MLERDIQERLLAWLRDLGFTTDSGRMTPPPLNGKASYRRVHAAQRAGRLAAEAGFVRARLPAVLRHFASGSEVDPRRIRPRLELVASGTEAADIFRLASLTWSVPVSRGYGRRMRFLAWDDANHKVIGIFALGDPVFNLRPRDALIGWDAEGRRQRLVHVMDAYVLGALPPYNMLLGGKLLACLIRTSEVVRLFAAKYRRAEGVISGVHKRASLALVTTSSALGRSSVYNRLSLGGQRYYQSIGYSSGWGHFHVPDDVFRLMREYLAGVGHPYASGHRFGDGPNWRLRVIRAAVDAIGMDPDLLRHGVGREIFICRLSDNADAILRGEARVARYGNLLSVSEVASLSLDRWVLPRAERRPEFRQWRREDITTLIDPCGALGLSSPASAGQKGTLFDEP